MTQRMIDDGWTSNPEFQRLSADDRLLALGLWNVADAVGRGPADPRWVRSKACPFSDDRLAEIEERLSRIAAALTNPNMSPGRLILYKANGALYYQWADFAVFQRFSDAPVPDHPDPPEYTWFPDRSDRRRKYAGRWEQSSDTSAPSPPHGTAQGAAPSVLPEAKREEPDEATPQREAEIREERLRRTAEADHLPEGYAQLKACHEKYAARLFTPDDDLKLRGAIKDAAEAGVPWMVLLTMMKNAQRDFRPTSTNPVIKAISYYCVGWDKHIRQAMAELERQAEARRTVRASPPGISSDDTPPDDETDPLAERARQQAAELARGTHHVAAS